MFHLLSHFIALFTKHYVHYYCVQVGPFFTKLAVQLSHWHQIDGITDYMSLVSCKLVIIGLLEAKFYLCRFFSTDSDIFYESTLSTV